MSQFNIYDMLTDIRKMKTMFSIGQENVEKLSAQLKTLEITKELPF